MKTLSTAIDLYRKGNAREAELVCESRLAAHVDDVESLALLAEIHLATARSASAVGLLKRLTQLRPRDAAAYRRLAGALLEQNRAGDAVDALRIAIELEPSSVRAHNNLGQALMRQDSVSDAIDSYSEALRIDEDYAIGHNNLGLALTADGDLERAAESFRRALALDPALAIAEVNLAIVFERRDELTEALRCYERALAKAPHLAEAWVGRGSVQTILNRFEVALECFDTALKLRPGDAAVLARKAFVLLLLERASESLDCVEAALRIEPSSAEAHNIRAGALRRLGRHSEALQSLDRALALSPDHVDAWCNRGMILHETGDLEAAVAACQRALDLDPDNIQARTRLLSRLIPSMPLSEEEVGRARNAFDAQILELESWLQARPLGLRDALIVAQQQFFYLTYQEISNRPLLERYRTAGAARLARLEHLIFTYPRVPPVTAERATQRLQVGFVSAHVHDHSVFNAILRGWLEHLDHDRFELALFSVGQKQDATSRAAAANVDHVEVGTRPVVDWVRAIRDRGLDALIFPEIGMNETTLALGGFRLAPRQFAAWGHPETSGLPTIDAYLSAELFEPVDAQAHYTERLLRLPNLGVHCRPYGMAPAPIDLERLGVSRDGPLLLCPGVPFKYRPQDDGVLVEIARRLGRCTFVFFQHEVAELSHKLRARISAAFRSAKLDPANFLVWIPWLPRDAFFGVLRQADVYLDTIGFSGFNTMMQAIECHLPCVTYEGRFMRGRLGSGILRRLGMTELVATEKTRYVDLAVNLATNAEYRAKVRETIRLAESAVYADMHSVGALANILLEN
jgi:predicted O-linked N-acetylglucosamine transferase (SPINDLY family)